MNPLDEQALVLGLHDKLAWLNKQDIPTVLKAQGIKGVRVNSLHCPIAELLRSHGFDVKVGYGAAKFRSSYRSVRLPDKVQKFISDFDSDEYPELIL